MRLARASVFQRPRSLVGVPQNITKLTTKFLAGVRLADQVDAEYIRTDDFAFMFEKCFRGAAENPQEEKITAFRGILVNSALRKDYSEEEKEYFVNLVNSLSALHIRILRFLHTPTPRLTNHSQSLSCWPRRVVLKPCINSHNISDGFP